VCETAQVKGLVIFFKLSHRTHCNPPHPTLDHNGAKKFLVISQRDSKWVLKFAPKKIATLERWNVGDNHCSDCNRIFKPHLRMMIMKTSFWMFLWWIIQKLILKLEKESMKVHLQDKNLIWTEKGSVDKIGFGRIIFVHQQYTMTNYLGGGTKWNEHCFVKFLKVLVHMICISCKSKMHLAT